MRHAISSVLFGACVCAATVAQQHGTFDGSTASLLPSPAIDAGPGGTGSLLDVGGAPPRLRTFGDYADEIEARRQDPDYSLLGMFHQVHGDFMLKRERYNPMIEARARWFPNAEVKNEDGHFDLLQWNVDAEWRPAVSTDGFLLFGLYADQRRYRVSNMGVNFKDENLNAVGVKLGFGVFLADSVLLEVDVKPGVWSDMDGTLHGKDFDYPGKALVTWQANDDFFLKFGVRYNQVYKDANWLPYLGFSWAIGEQFRLDVLLPELVEFSWWPSSSFGVLAGTEITGAQYHVRTTEADGNQRADAQVQEVIAYGGLMWRMTDGFSLLGRVGLVLGGDYELTYGASFSNTVDGSLRQTLFAEFSVGIDF